MGEQIKQNEMDRASKRHGKLRNTHKILAEKTEDRSVHGRRTNKYGYKINVK
jgi:hypothetical protein